MKIRHFLSIFFVMTMALSLWAPSAAAEGESVPDPAVQAKAALLVDQKTGAVVYAKDEHQELYPASTTKIMTCFLVLEAVDQGRLALDQTLTASATAFTGLAEDGSTAGIQPGEMMTVENLLYCMMLGSANEASTILAEAVSGSVEAFVEAMNAKAEALGCVNTHFMNPHGLHSAQHYTSAWDLYLIAKAALEYPDFMRICDTSAYTVPATNLSEARQLHNSNYLISGWRSRGYLNSDAHGIKTGSTSQAGHCLVSSAERGTRSFLSVVMGADRVLLEDGETWWTYSFGETNRLFEWAFDNFAYQTVFRETDAVGEVAVALSRSDRVTVRPAQTMEILLPKHVTAEDLEPVITWKSDPVEAPIAEGDVLGSLVLRLDGKDCATVDLLAFSDVEASRLRVLWRDIQDFFSQTAVRVVLAVAGGLALLALGWKLVFGGRRYRYGRSVKGGRSRGYRGRRR